MLRSMITSLVAAAVGVGCAGSPVPPGGVDCPPGSERDGERCVAVEVHCPGGARWDGSRCVATAVEPAPEPAVATGRDITGDYSGEISVNGRATRVDTSLRVRDGAIGGEYVYGPQREQGRFSGCRLSGSKLRCTWLEAELSGTFSVELADDDQSFSGGWEFSDGRPGGTWTGRRGGAVVAAPTVTAPPVSAPGSITGTYRGLIGVGGRSGPVVTELDASSGRVTGRYEYGGNPGQLSECRFVAPRLSCKWTEGGMTGGFRVELARDLASFSGVWDFSDGQPGGSWTGKR